METRHSLFIKNTIKKFINELEGEFVQPKNNYESAFCNVFSWKRNNSRYFDAIDKRGSKIEIKKGQSGMWFDLVRYAEIQEGIGDQNTYTVFFLWEKKTLKIKEAYVIRTKVLMSQFKLSKRDWQYAIRLKKKVPRSLNMLASLTWKDLKKIATHIIIS